MDSRGFFQGFLWGALIALFGGLFLLYSLNMLGIVGVTLIDVPQFQQLLIWTYHNLGLSLLPFTLTLALFAWTVRKLQRSIRQNSPVEEVSQLDHLSDLWTGLFFGIGVIWTAIGMRSALVYALGDPETTAADGAFNLLRNLVDGGILIALSTTIFGGVGGYLMRVFKTVMVGNALRSYYNQHAEQAETAVIEQLQAIENRLASLGGATGPEFEEDHHESKPMVSD